MPASAAITKAATVKIQVLALRALPISGGTIRPDTPPAVMEVQVAAYITGPITVSHLLHRFLFIAAHAHPREAQVHRVAIRASPTIPIDPFVSVLLPWLGACVGA